MPAYAQVPTISPPVPVRTPVKKPVDFAPGMTNLGGIPQPVTPTPLQSPNLPPSPQAPGFTFNPTTIGAAPTATPYGAFTPPDPSQLANDTAVQFRFNQSNQGWQRGAAAHGNLFAGGFQARLARLNQDLASQEIDNQFQRALTTYGANRDTNAQNFGQSLGSYNAGTNATLDANRLNLAGETAGYDRRYGSLRDAYGDARDAAETQTGVINTNAQARDAFERQMADYRAQVEAQRAADMARQNAAAAAGTGFAPPRRPLPGSARTHLGG